MLVSRRLPAGFATSIVPQPRQRAGAQIEIVSSPRPTSTAWPPTRTPTTSSPPSKATGTCPAPSSSTTSGAPDVPRKTVAVARVGCPAKGSSSSTVKMRTRVESSYGAAAAGSGEDEAEGGVRVGVQVGVESLPPSPPAGEGGGGGGSRVAFGTGGALAGGGHARAVGGVARALRRGRPRAAPAFTGGTDGAVVTTTGTGWPGALSEASDVCESCALSVCAVPALSLLALAVAVAGACALLAACPR